jgi:hypothetical protein
VARSSGPAAGAPFYTRSRRLPIQFSLSEAIIGAKSELGSRFLTEEQFRHLVGGLRPVPLRPAGWPYDQTRYYAGEDLLVWARPTKDGIWSVKLGARHPRALDSVQDH